MRRFSRVASELCHCLHELLFQFFFLNQLCRVVQSQCFQTFGCHLYQVVNEIAHMIYSIIHFCIHPSQIHEQRHVQKRPFPCPLCPKSFIRHCDLRAHMSRATVHGGIRVKAESEMINNNNKADPGLHHNRFLLPSFFTSFSVFPPFFFFLFVCLFVCLFVVLFCFASLFCCFVFSQYCVVVLFYLLFLFCHTCHTRHNFGCFAS